jgi:hypothetical protein
VVAFIAGLMLGDDSQHFARAGGSGFDMDRAAAAAVALVAGTAASLRAGEAGWRALRGVWLGALAILILFGLLAIDFGLQTVETSYGEG